MNRLLKGTLLALAASGLAVAASIDAARSVRIGEAYTSFDVAATDNPALVARRAQFLILHNQVTPAAAPQLIDAARKTLAQDPITPGALILLGVGNKVLGRGDGSAALSLAERLSRREAGGEVLQLQAALVAADAPQVVRHFDHILAVNPDVISNSMPVVVPLLADPRYRDQFAKYGGRAWFPAFVASALDSGASPRSLVGMVEKSGAGLPPAESARLNGLLIKHAVARNDPAVALAVAGRVLGKGAGKIGELGFLPETTDDRISPLGWRLVVDDHVVARLIGQGGLEIVVDPDYSASAAQRATFLAPGAYALQTDLTFDSGDQRARLTWHVTCGGAGGPAILNAVLPDRAGSVHAESRFVVPTDCGNQFWQLMATGQTDQNSSRAIVSRVELLVG